MGGNWRFVNTLHFTTLYLTVLHFTTLYLTVLHFNTLYLTALYFTTLYLTVLHFTKLYLTVLHYNVLGAMHFNDTPTTRKVHKNIFKKFCQKKSEKKIKQFICNKTVLTSVTAAYNGWGKKFVILLEMLSILIVRHGKLKHKQLIIPSDIHASRHLIQQLGYRSFAKKTKKKQYGNC